MKRISMTIFLLVLAACGSSGGGGGGGGNLPGTLQLGSNSYGVAEGAVVNITVTRSGGSSGIVSVDYATADGTAEAGTDYPETIGTLTFADGVSGNQTISIAIIDDNLAEFLETFTVTLSNVSRATLGARSTAAVNITDSDTAVLPITGNNAQYITITVLEATASTVDVIDILDVIGLPTIAGTPPGLANAVVRDITTDIIACDTGEAKVTWNDVDNNFVISTGDTFDIVFTMCFFADVDTTFDGPMSLTNLVVTGDPFNQIAPWGLSLTIGFDNLQRNAAFTDGDLDLALNSEDNVVVDLSVATASLTSAFLLLPGYSATLSDFVLAETLDLNALTEVINSSGTFANTFLQGAVDFETLQDVIIIGDDNPSAGQFLISDSSSSVLVTVLDNISVQLDIDVDLDGMIDLTIIVPWTNLDID